MMLRPAVFIVFSSLLLRCTSYSKENALKTFTLEELIPLQAEFFPERLHAQWISDHEYIYKDAMYGFRKYNAITDEFDVYLDSDVLQNLTSTFSIAPTSSKNGKFLLLYTNSKKVYRYSNLAEYSVYDVENKLLRNISSGQLQVVVWGGAQSLAYVQNNNVYYIPDAAKPSQVYNLTTDGVPGEVYHGTADWIYEEEILNAAEAMWFSPEGTYLAVASFNDTDVESAVYPYYGDASDINNQYPHMVEFKYPKAGQKNPSVGLHVFKLDDPNGEPWKIPAPVDEIGLDHILGRVNWATDQNLIVLWLNRRQNISLLLNCDLKKDKCSIVHQRQEQNGWIDIKNPYFSANGTHMIEIQPLYQEFQRFFHVARLDFEKQTIEDLTPGNATVTDILGWNSERDIIYFTVVPSKTPWLSQLWEYSKGKLRCISCKEPLCRYTKASFSPKADYAIMTCSASNVPPKVYLYNTLKDNFKVIKYNARLAMKLGQYKLPLHLFNILNLGPDLLAHVELLMPPDVKPGEKYPMVVKVYAGPGTSMVKDKYDLEYYHMYLAANRSYVVAYIDVRGSGLMGVEAMHAVNNALGSVEITDTLAAIKQLTTLYPFIDLARVAVWGWSYGGFATTMMMMQDTENIIKCGAAVAPVSSWLYYDSIYTERFMDLPKANAWGYAQSTLMTKVERLRGRKYMLVHGTGDDNVHYQHSMLLAKELQHADIAFEQLSYTDENHSLLGVSRHFYHALDRFWTECFQL